MEIFQIGFLKFRLLDMVDILAVTFLLYGLYNLLKGSLAIRIIYAIAGIFMIWKIVGLLGLSLLKTMLDQFLSAGTIALVILFAPEIRRFLLIIGKNTFLDRLRMQLSTDTSLSINFNDILESVVRMSETKTGAIMVFTGSSEMKILQSTGDVINAELNERLIISIFNKNSPLHDGAMIIHGNRIVAARCVLPVTDNPHIPAELGMRHRASIGISESSDALVVIVSEETGHVSVALNGVLHRKVRMNELRDMLEHHYSRHKNAMAT
jgi:diadenylate cyclase